MKCVRCEKETGHAKVQYCKECFFIEFMWQFRNNPFVYEDIKYERQPDGSYKEIPIIKGINIKKDKEVFKKKWLNVGVGNVLLKIVNINIRKNIKCYLMVMLVPMV